jgi:hypothetical protein
MTANHLNGALGKFAVIRLFFNRATGKFIFSSLLKKGQMQGSRNPEE